MYKAKGVLRRGLLGACVFLIKMYVFFTAPWVRARFYAAWHRYQKDSVYRERLIIMGFEYAFKAFLNCKASREYVLRLRFEEEPSLKWRLRFLPWTIPMPEIFETAARSGIFKEMFGAGS